jgi:dihydroneopterin aldolase
MDETAIAFELPHVRASATHAGPPLDRISVRDYVRAVEIGAFRTERGVTQRLRFNVVLEVAHHAATKDDDVDQVVSYDSITEAIEAAIAAERLNLLETLAERVAQGCLADPRVVRAFVRVEKLDRVPGTLGVEIVRSRRPEAAPRLHPVAEPLMPGSAVLSRVVYLPHAVLDGPSGASWLDALVAWGRPVVLCTGPAEPQPRAATEGRRRIGLLAIEQAAWALADRDPRFGVAASRTEIDWALKTGRLSVWAPARMATSSLAGPVPDASAPADLAAWLAVEIGAEMLVVAGDAAPGGAALPALRRIAHDRPEDLTTTG